MIGGVEINLHCSLKNTNPDLEEEKEKRELFAWINSNSKILEVIFIINRLNSKKKKKSKSKSKSKFFFPPLKVALKIISEQKEEFIWDFASPQSSSFCVYGVKTCFGFEIEIGSVLPPSCAKRMTAEQESSVVKCPNNSYLVTRKIHFASIEQTIPFLGAQSQIIWRKIDNKKDPSHGNYFGKILFPKSLLPSHLQSSLPTLFEIASDCSDENDSGSIPAILIGKTTEDVQIRREGVYRISGNNQQEKIAETVLDVAKTLFPILKEKEVRQDLSDINFFFALQTIWLKDPRISILDALSEYLDRQIKRNLFQTFKKSTSLSSSHTHLKESGKVVRTFTLNLRSGSKLPKNKEFLSFDILDINPKRDLI